MRDVRALDVQDLHRMIRELADVFDSAEWRNEPLTGALVAAALRKGIDVGGRRGSRLSQRLRSVVRRNLRRGPRLTDVELLARMHDGYHEEMEAHT